PSNHFFLDNQTTVGDLATPPGGDFLLRLERTDGQTADLSLAVTCECIPVDAAGTAVGEPRVLVLSQGNSWQARQTNSSQTATHRLRVQTSLPTGYRIIAHNQLASPIQAPESVTLTMPGSSAILRVRANASVVVHIVKPATMSLPETFATECTLQPIKSETDQTPVGTALTATIWIKNGWKQVLLTPPSGFHRVTLNYPIPEGCSVCIYSSFQSAVEPAASPKLVTPLNAIARSRVSGTDASGKSLVGPGATNPMVVEKKKYFVFNQTGNVMVSTTVDTSAEIQAQAQKLFNEVTVFFAAMSKAITTTVNPLAEDKKTPYSIYNYDALAKVILKSGFFINTTREDISYSSSSFGVDFSRELITGLLGLPTGAGGLAFASSLIAAMGSEGVRLQASSTEKNSKVAHIVFVCEYLLGMPMVSAIVTYVDSSEANRIVKAGPCASAESKEIKMNLHKDVYMFVTPTFIKEYSGDLNSTSQNEDFGAFTSHLKDLLEDKK
ncbi:MAG TPA: hypothetical protein VIM48_03200, partial [Chthoniobacterales bacterium]